MNRNTANPLPVTASRNAHGRTLDRLGEAIVAGRYAPGSAVPTETALCTEFGVSRTVVREAIKSLVAKGLLSTGPKVGTRVRPADEWNGFDAEVVAWHSRSGLMRGLLRDLQDLRAVVEPAAARLAAERATPHDVAVLTAACAAMQAAIDDGDDPVEHLLAFHQALLHASGNRLLMQMAPALGPLLRTSWALSSVRREAPEPWLRGHRAVLDAVVAKSPLKAERAVERLIAPAQAAVQELLASRRKLPVLQRPPARRKPASA